MAINNRELVSYVRDHQGVAPDVLAQHFGVSTRTVRTYVRRANEGLSPFAHIQVRYGGYELAVKDEGLLAAWLRADERVGGSRALPTTSRERVAYLTDELLTRADWITKAELAEQLFVSDSTISHDLALVEEKLGEFGLSLERRPHYGIRVSGDEMARRLCIASMVASGLLEGTDAEEGPVRELLPVVSRCVDEVVRRDSFSISSFAHRNLLVHIAVALLRIEKGCYVPMPSGGVAISEGAREREVARDIAVELEGATGVVLPEEEVAYIAIHLASKQMVEDVPDARDGIVISDQVWGLVSDMLEVVLALFHFDFRDNLELRMNLARHIVPLAYRLTYHMNLENPLLRDIKTRYPLAWSMAVESSSVLGDAYGRPLSEDEIGYIALSFALALERERSETAGKSILLVCASGAGTAKLLEHLYRREFGPWLREIRTCDAAHVGEADFSKIDYVFTTVPLGTALPVPVREVSVFLDESETRNVRELLSGRAAQGQVAAYFDRELFFPHVPGTSKQEVLDWLCARREEYGGAGTDFRELVLRREEAMPTTFGNRVAMPHPLEAVSERTLVAVGITDEPVSWGSHDVQVVFLLSVARDEAPPRSFYGTLASLMVDADAMERLVSERRWETLMALLASAGQDG